MLPTEDIVPITYMSGAGGNFLCNFIVSAKRNIKTVIELSEHGNAHGGMRDIDPSSRGINWSDKDKIDYLLHQLTNPNPSIEKPYYVNCHVKDINLISNTFKKSIRIIYDLDDVKEIAVVFYGKWKIDEDKIKPFSIAKSNIMIRSFQSKFTKLDNMPNVLFISWKELFKGNIEELIIKLSTFTEIDSNNFSCESLMHWRNKTQYCIDKFTDIC